MWRGLRCVAQGGALRNTAEPPPHMEIAFLLSARPVGILIRLQPAPAHLPLVESHARPPTFCIKLKVFGLLFRHSRRFLLPVVMPLFYHSSLPSEGF